MAKTVDGGKIVFGVGVNIDKASFDSLSKSLQNLQNIKAVDFSGSKKELDNIKETAHQVQQALKQAFNIKLSSLNTSTFNQSLKSMGLNVDKIYSDFSKAGAQGQVAFSQMTRSVLTSNLQLKQTHSILNSLGDTFMKTIKWSIASKTIQAITSSISGAFTYVKSLDAALTDIRIVTKDSADEMERFADRANKAAQALGRSTMDYTKAALTFYQQGLNDQEVQTRTQAVLKAQNITGAGQEMADYLTAVWNGYRVANEQAELYVDKLAAVADSSASNMSQLAVAMSKVSSTAGLLGVDVDSLSAQIATIVATTRTAPQSVGNALKTIYSRINDIATGAEDAEISLGNYSSKMLQVGISVLDANGKLRDTGDVIDEIGGKWETLSREQQIYLARTMAGQRQYNNLLALFENWGKYTDLLNVSMNSQGTLVEKNSIYMESLAAKMETLGAATERIKTSLIDENDLKGLIDGVTKVANVFGSFIQSIGGGKGLLLNFGSIFTSLFSNVIGKQINNIVTNFQNIRHNNELWQKEIADTKTFLQSEGYSQGIIRDFVNEKQMMHEYYSVMSNEEKKEYDQLLINQQVERQNKAILEEKIGLVSQFREAVEQQAKSGQQTVADAETELNAFIGEFDTTLTDFKTHQKEIPQEILNEIEETKKKIDEEINSTMHTSFNPIEDMFENVDLTDPFETIRDKAIEPITKGMTQLEQKFGKQFPTAFEEYSKALEAFKEKNKITQADLGKLRQAAQSAVKALMDASDLHGKQSGLNEQLKESQAKIADYENKLSQIRSTLSQSFNIQILTKFVGGLGAVASSISNIRNLTRIWNNENLSAGEKILQTMTNLSMTAVQISRAYGSLIKPVLRHLALKQAQLKYEREKTLQILEQKILQETSSKELLSLLLQRQALENGIGQSKFSILKKEVKDFGKNIIKWFKDPVHIAITAGIAFATLLGVTLYKAWNKQADAAKRAAETAAAAKKNYDDLKQSYEQLKQSLQNYTKAQQALSKLTKNTQEWRDSLREANDIVLDLIQKFPQLAQYVSNEGGQLILSQEGQDAALRASQSRVNAARNASLVSSAYSRDAAIIAQAAKIRHELFGLQESDEINGNYNEAIIKVAQALNKNGQATEENTGVSKWLIDRILTETRAVNELRQSITENTLATDVANEQIAAEALSNNVDYKGLTSEMQKVANKVGSKAYEQAVKDAQKTIYDQLTGGEVSVWSNANNEVLQDVLRRLNAAQHTNWTYDSNASRGFDSNRSLAFRDEQGNEVVWTAELVSQTIAASEALKDLGASAQDSAKLFNDLKNVFADEKIQTGILGLLSNGNVAGNLTQVQYNNALSGLGNPIEQMKMAYLYQSNEQTFKNLGFESAKAFIEAYRSGLENNANRFDDNLKSINFKLTNGLSKIISKNLTLDAQTALVDAFKKIYKTGGEEGLKEFEKFFSEQAQQQLGKLLQEVDVGSLEGIDSLTEKVKELGINIDTSSPQWEKFLDYLRQTAIVGQESAAAISGFTDALKEFNKIKKLSIGDVIDQQTYNKLIKINPAFKEFFSIAVDGYALISDDMSLIEKIFGSSSTIDQKITKIKELQVLGKQLIEDFSVDQIGTELASGNLDSYISEALGQGYLQNYKAAQDTVEAYQKAIANGPVSEPFKKAKEEAETTLKEIENLMIDFYTKAQNGEYSDAAIRSIKALNEQTLEDFRSLYYQEEIALQDYAKYNDVYVAKQRDRLKITKDEYNNTYAAVREELEKTSSSFNKLNDIEKDVQTDQLTVKIYDLAEALDELADISADTFAEMAQQIAYGNTNNLTFIENLSKLQDVLEKLFGVELDPQFIINNFDKISQFASGNIAIFDELREKLLTDTLTVSVDTQGAQDQVAAFLNSITNLDDIKLGATLDDAKITDAFTRLVMAAGLTAEEANKILAQIGFEPQVEYREVPIQSVHVHQIGNDWALFDPNDSKNSIRMSSAEYEQVQASGVVKFPIINGGKIKKVNIPTSSSFLNMARPGWQGNSKGSKGGGSTKRPNVTQPKRDPYYDNNKALAKQKDILSQLQKEQKKLSGEERLKNLQLQNEALKHQQTLYKERQGIAKSEMQRIQDWWKKEGIDVILNADGSIADGQYQSIQNQLAARKTAYDAWFNSLSEDEQYAIQNGTGALHDQYEFINNELMNSIENYDKAWDQAKSSIDNINEQIEQFYENNIEMANLVVELKLDTNEAYRDWLDFEKKIVKRIKDDDYIGQALYSKERIKSYQSDLVESLAKVDELRGRLANMRAGNTDSIYGTNIKQLEEDLKKYENDAKSAIEAINDEIEQAQQNYLNQIKKSNEALNKHLEKYNKINNLIENNVKLIQLLYGDNANQYLTQWYDKQVKNNREQLKEQVQLLKYYQQMANDAKSEEEKEIWEGYIEDTLSNINNLVNDSIELMHTRWTNEVDKLIKHFNDGISGGKGLENIETEWDLIGQFDDQFLDAVNRQFERDDVQRAYQKAIDAAAGDTRQQSRLRDLMDEQLKILDEKANLTEYDVKRAKALLDIEQARYNLEEARNQKTKMRLRRDSQGNYTYQYVADEEKLSDLQDALAKAENDLYNLDKDEYESNLNKMLNVYKEYLEKRREAEEEYLRTGDYNKYLYTTGMLDTQYGNIFSGYEESQEYIANNLQQSSGGQMPAMTNSGLATFMQTIHEAGGLIPATAGLIQTWSEVTDGTVKGIKDIISDGDVNLNSILQGVDENITGLTNALAQEKDILTEQKNYIAEMKNIAVEFNKMAEGLITLAQFILLANTALETNATGTPLSDYLNSEEGTEVQSLLSTLQTLKDYYEDRIAALDAETFATGGYTGDWVADGRIGILHQKQLVLNETDTANILAAVGAVRAMTGSIMNAASSEIGGLTSGISSTLGGLIGRETLDQNVHIDATFPNVTDHLEIEQAFTNLVNIASQYASRPARA